MATQKSDIPTSQEKLKKARKANAEKQKRFRESMKAKGYRANLFWEKPLEDGWVRMVAPVIQKSSIEAVKNIPVIREVLEDLYWSFSIGCEKRGIPKEEWEPVFRDIGVLLKPLIGETKGY